PADGLPGLLAGARPSGRLAAFTALRLCRPGGRVTFFDAKKVTKETGLCQREVPLIGGLARTGTAADAHPRSSPCEASMPRIPVPNHQSRRASNGHKSNTRSKPFACKAGSYKTKAPL